MSVSFQMGEADSRITATEAARDKLRQKALSEAGAYIETEQVLRNGKLSETLTLLKSALVAMDDEHVRVVTDPETQVQILHLDANVSIDSRVLRERVNALSNDAEYRAKLNRLMLAEQKIENTASRLQNQVRGTSLARSLETRVREILASAKARTIALASALKPGVNSSLLDRAQYGSELLELGKLVAMDKYITEIIIPYGELLEARADVVAVTPSDRASDGVQVSVDFELKAKVDVGNIVHLLSVLETKLEGIRAGEFWLPNQQKRMSDLQLGAFDVWVDEVLDNTPLAVLVSVGSQKAFYPALGIRESFMGDRGFDYGLRPVNDHMAFSEFPMEFTKDSGRQDERTVTRHYVFHVPNAEAAKLKDVTVEIRLVRVGEQDE
ncbi:hypothetical protein [Marinobacter sp. F3R08]|uniref:hypothetical protein n=1 Tax=Marinobacter sp. F3R08 TaxID=2841559 RepID=UPI001C08093D|nr:hypothetical protein [Marinobacter sp. F3R08]MBU2952319.1 hypothetical protein [Marinobacter sp. F3R08]